MSLNLSPLIEERRMGEMIFVFKFYTYASATSELNGDESDQNVSFHDTLIILGHWVYKSYYHKSILIN